MQTFTDVFIMKSTARVTLLLNNAAMSLGLCLTKVSTFLRSFIKFWGRMKSGHVIIQVPNGGGVTLLLITQYDSILRG